MGNSLRCCLACVLPCGALDVVRIVHLNGHVEEYGRPVSAGEILAANPNHIITKPCLQGVNHKILIVSPESDLKRGHIYFLIPESSLTEKRKKKKKKKQHQRSTAMFEVSDQDYFLKEVPSEKKSGHRRRRSGRVGVWRPHLESISEDP
ncbi:uncharacterized protein [Elaeis guineensis]|uniref:Uncharacterized protein LOC105045915 n=1 Tax=Elaeis guineensis var. tenera TaxID=51953 RepID=A0A6I9R9P1_ELAGV|nr:uncharacterized protein LOC105045915 [Elaeis guineensis]